MVDIIIVTKAILQMHIVVNGRKDIFLGDVFRDQVVDITFDIRHYLPELEDPKSLGVTELVYYPVLEKILEENDTFEDR